MAYVSAVKKKCPNCIDGYIIRAVPMDKIKDYESGELVYGEKFEGKYIEYGYRCPVCSGGEAIIENIKQKANIPASFYSANIDQFDWSIYGEDTMSIKRAVLGWMQNYKKFKAAGVGLYLWSRTRGSGKTFLASAICNSLAETYKARPKFVNAANIIALDKDGQAEDLAVAELLVIDDIGQKVNTWVDDILYRITDHRVQHKMPTIFTSNIPRGELDFDDRVVSRIYDLAPEIHLPEYSVRTRQADMKHNLLFQEYGLTD